MLSRRLPGRTTFAVLLTVVVVGGVSVLHSISVSGSSSSSLRSDRSPSTPRAQFSPVVYGGLTNQLISLYGSILTSVACDYDLVLPKWHVAQIQEWLPFEALYTLDMQALAGTPLAGLRTIPSLDPSRQPLCDVQLRDPPAARGMVEDSRCLIKGVNDLEERGRDVVLCSTPHNTFYTLATSLAAHYGFVRTHGSPIGEEVTEKRWLRLALRPAQRYVTIVDTIVASALAKLNVTTFAVVHPRLEGDFKYACNQWPPDLVNGVSVTCFANETFMLEAVRRGGVPCGSPVLAMSADVSKAEDVAISLPVLCGRPAGCDSW